MAESTDNTSEVVKVTPPLVSEVVDNGADSDTVSCVLFVSILYAFSFI